MLSLGILLLFSRSVLSNFVTPWSAPRPANLSFTVSHSLPKLMSIESKRPSNHLILRRPLLLLPSVLPGIRGFSSELALHIHIHSFIFFFLMRTMFKVCIELVTIFFFIAFAFFLSFFFFICSEFCHTLK